jgi:hypothetical protein
MDWEVHICSLHESSYRPAEELITEAVHDHEQSLGITISLVLLWPWAAKCCKTVCLCYICWQTYWQKVGVRKNCAGTKHVNQLVWVLNHPISWGV